MTSARDKRCWIINGANGDMRAGIYRVKFVKDGPWLRARLTEDGSGELDPDTGAWVWTSDVTYRLEVDGQHIRDPQTKFLSGLVGEEITEAEFQFMAATAEHEAKYGPAEPPAPPPPMPTIDPMTAPPPF